MVRSVQPKKSTRAQRPTAKGKANGPRKAVSKGQVKNGVLEIFSDIERADVVYLLKGFKASPQLVPWLASLMRDGVMANMWQVKLAGEQPAQLGNTVRRLIQGNGSICHLAFGTWCG